MSVETSSVSSVLFDFFNNENVFTYCVMKVIDIYIYVSEEIGLPGYLCHLSCFCLCLILDTQLCLRTLRRGWLRDCSALLRS